MLARGDLDFLTPLVPATWLPWLQYLAVCASVISPRSGIRTVGNLAQGDVGVEGLILRVRHVALIVIIPAGHSRHVLRMDLTFSGLVLAAAPRLRAVLERHRAAARLLRERFAARRVHVERTPLRIMIRQIVVVEQLLRCSDIVRCLATVAWSCHLIVQLLVLLNLILLLHRRIHIRLDRLLTVASRLEDLRLVRLGLLSSSERIQLARVLGVVARQAQDLILRQLLARLRFK